MRRQHGPLRMLAAAGGGVIGVGGATNAPCLRGCEVGSRNAGLKPVARGERDIRPRERSAWMSPPAMEGREITGITGTRSPPLTSVVQCSRESRVRSHSEPAAPPLTRAAR